jgi:23S rRNA (uridine2552-2'-O)-methyltransferase
MSSTYTQRRKLGVNKLKNKNLRKESSRRWILRQLNDPYVHEAQAQGYRSRAAFKLIEIDKKYKLLKPGQAVVDLGAAPGGWTQVLVKRLKTDKPSAQPVVGIDLQEMDTLPGSVLLHQDFTDPEALVKLNEHIPDKLDGVVSDMAPFSCGIANVDHIRITGLIESAYDFAQRTLKPGGYFVAKVLQGGTDSKLLSIMRQDFQKVSHFKPQSSRKDSSEKFVVAQGFRRESSNLSNDN